MKINHRKTTTEGFIIRFPVKHEASYRYDSGDPVGSLFTHSKEKAMLFLTLTEVAMRIAQFGDGAPAHPYEDLQVVRASRDLHTTTFTHMEEEVL